MQIVYRSNLCLGLFFLFLAGLTFTGTVPANGNVEQPNIIWIMADDLGYGDLGVYGQKEIKTPHIDNLAEEGTRFSQVYAGSTVCGPTRCVLMTGKHTGHSRVRGNSARTEDKSRRMLVPLRPEDVTVAEVLKAAGYTTGVTGKWGLGERGSTGLPNDQGFDEWLGFLNQKHAHGYYPEYLWRNREIQIYEGNLGGHQKEWIHSEFTKFSLDFIKANKDKPFFLYVAYTNPHGRYEIPDDKPYSDKPWPQDIKNYAAMVTRMDDDVGKIIDLLKTLELDEKTIVFFTSDNGAEKYYFDKKNMRETYAKILNSSGPVRGYKRDLTDGGIRVPMIARWPGHIPAGKVSDHVWAFWDFLPTAADIAGVQAPPGIDGKSVLPTLLGQDQEPHEFLYWEFFERGFQQAVRYKNWKAIRTAQNAPLRLFNIDTDIREENDVADEHPKVIEKIEQYLSTARTQSDFWPYMK